VQPTEDPARTLASTLRGLRLTGLGRKITQGQLAQALDCSTALISSWERPDNPVVPPVERIAEYAGFFGTTRSVERRPYRLIAERDLTADEIAQRDELLARLTRLRTAALSGSEPPALHWPAESPSLVGKGPWHFPAEDTGKPVVIVCPERPRKELDAIPHSNPRDPDHSELSRITDADALLELHGHIRAVNPDLRVEWRSVGNLRRDDFTGHLVVLGGVDWNAASRDVMRRIEAPVNQVSENDPMYRGCFQVVGDQTKAFAPVIEDVDGRKTLVEDVGYFFRGPNPYNPERTVTLCNGMFGRGVLGAVRALTDKELRDKNADYIDGHFGGHDSYSILFRVPVIDERVAVTPDWNTPPSVLHAWPEKSE
jgi:hypothetical protein